MTEESPWMSVAQVRVYAGTGETTTYHALQTGELRGVQRTSPRGTWRIHRDDIDTWLRGLHPESVERKPLRRVVPKRRAS